MKKTPSMEKKKETEGIEINVKTVKYFQLERKKSKYGKRIKMEKYSLYKRCKMKVFK